MTKSRIRVGVVGCGYWGPNLIRNFTELEDVELVAVCDRHPEKLEPVLRQHPGLESCQNHLELVHDRRIDAVAVATTVSSHFEIAQEALREGKHVLVEKPFVSTSDQARTLIELAEREKLVLMVGHTFVYHGAVRKIRELLRGGELGDLLYLDSTRANWGILQDDINVVWDLAPHDISIMDYLLEQAIPESVCATGSSHTGRGLEDVAFLTFHFPNNLIGHVNINWLSPVKVRTMLLGGSRKMVVYDDNQPSEKVKVYTQGILSSNGEERRHNDLLHYRTGDVFVPKLNLTEALRTEVRDFIDSIRTGGRPLADGHSGLRVVRLLELACLSLARGGAPIEVPPE